MGWTSLLSVVSAVLPASGLLVGAGAQDTPVRGGTVVVAISADPGT